MLNYKEGYALLVLQNVETQLKIALSRLEAQHLVEQGSLITS